MGSTLGRRIITKEVGTSLRWKVIADLDVKQHGRPYTFGMPNLVASKHRISSVCYASHGSITEHLHQGMVQIEHQSQLSILQQTVLRLNALALFTSPNPLYPKP